MEPSACLGSFLSWHGSSEPAPTLMMPRKTLVNKIFIVANIKEVVPLILSSPKEFHGSNPTSVTAGLKAMKEALGACAGGSEWACAGPARHCSQRPGAMPTSYHPTLKT